MQNIRALISGDLELLHLYDGLVVSQPIIPMIVIPLPDYLWQVIVLYLFELDGMNWFLVIDYFSRYPEFRYELLQSIIHSLQMGYHIVCSDNRTQLSSQEFGKFIPMYWFKLWFSSPRNHESNGQVEQTLNTVKQMFTKSKNFY